MVVCYMNACCLLQGIFLASVSQSAVPAKPARWGFKCVCVCACLSSEFSLSLSPSLSLSLSLPFHTRVRRCVYACVCVCIFVCHTVYAWIFAPVCLSWVTNEVMDLCDQRWQLKQQKYTSTDEWLKYRKKNSEIRMIERRWRQEVWIETQCKNIEKGMMSGKSKNGLQHSPGSHLDPTAGVSSQRRQQWTRPDGKHSCSKPVDWVLQWPVQLRTPSRHQPTPEEPDPYTRCLKSACAKGRGWRGCK